MSAAAYRYARAQYRAARRAWLRAACTGAGDAPSPFPWLTAARLACGHWDACAGPAQAWELWERKGESRVLRGPTRSGLRFFREGGNA